MIKEILLNEIDWNIYNDNHPFNKDGCHIFKISTSSYYDSIHHNYQKVLAENELIKANRFFKKADRERFIASKYALRYILSKFLITNPSSLQFHQIGNKKPAIKGIEFNVSHSKNLILIAIGKSKIGIDIEFVNLDFDFETIIDTCFNSEERLHVNSSNTFYQLWTRKEALLKATGEGITDQIQEINILDKNIIRLGKNYQIKTFSTPDHQYIFSIAIENIYHHKLCFWNFH